VTLPAPRTLLWMAVAATLSACTLFPERPANRIFQLPAPTVSESEGSANPVDSTLRLAIPHAEAPIDSARILVKPGGNEIKAYQGVRWSNKAPVLVQDHLVDAFRRDGRFNAILTGTSPARSDLTLAGDLSAFQSEYRNGSPVVRLRLDLQLIDERSRSTVASQRFEQTHPASGEAIEAVVAAFGEASDKLAREVIEWTLEQRR